MDVLRPHSIVSSTSKSVWVLGNCPWDKLYFRSWKSIAYRDLSIFLFDGYYVGQPYCTSLMKSPFMSLSFLPFILNAKSGCVRLDPCFTGYPSDPID